MKSIVYILFAVFAVLLVAAPADACPVELRAAVVQDHCAVQLNAAPVVLQQQVQHYVAPQTAAIVVQPQVAYSVAPQIVYQRQAVVLQQAHHAQAIVVRQNVKRDFATPIRDRLQQRQNARALRQDVRALQQLSY